MSRFFWKTPSYIYIAFGTHQQGRHLALHIRVKDAIPKWSLKTGALLASRCAENGHWDHFEKRIP